MSPSAGQRPEVQPGAPARDVAAGEYRLALRKNPEERVGREKNLPTRCAGLHNDGVSALQTIGAAEVEAAIGRLAAAIAARHPSRAGVMILGIANGGIELARRLGERLRIPAGIVDISFHRDDFGSHPIPKETTASRLPAEVQGATVILVDDVLVPGRTEKAAINEIFDHGRPEAVELAVLVDRGCRRLPFTADHCGLRLPAAERQRVSVRLDSADPRRDAINIEASTR